MGSTAKDGEHSRGGAVGPGMVELKSPPHFFFMLSLLMMRWEIRPLSLALLGLSQAHPSAFGQTMSSSSLSLPFLPWTGST